MLFNFLLCRPGRKKINSLFLTVFLMTGSVVDALILEAPYTSMTEAATVNPLASVRPPYTDSSPLGILVFTIQRYVLCVFRNTKHFLYRSNSGAQRQRVILFVLFTFPGLIFFSLSLAHPALYVPSRISDLNLGPT